MKVRRRTMLRRSLVLLSLVALFPALGCAGKAAVREPAEATTDATRASGADVDAGLPKALEAVIGRTETSAGTWSLWYVTREGDATIDLPADYVLGCGERSPSVVYSDLNTGRLYNWRPGRTSPDDVISLAPLGSGQVLGDVMAVSPDGARLALVRYQQAAGSTGEAEETAPAARGFTVDLQTGANEDWEWLETTAGGDEVTALHWNSSSSSFYVSFGPAGGSQGERSYRYDVDTGELVELNGVAAVLEVGPQGQVVGLGAAQSPSDLDYPTGSQDGHLPLVLWADDEVMRLPRDPDLASWDLAWMSDDAKTIVVRGSHEGSGGPRPCLEVLGLGDAGWELRRLLSGDDSLEIVYGVGFGPGTSWFYFQGGMPPKTSGGLVTDVRLYGLDTVTGETSRFVGLPGGDTGRYLQTLTIVGSDSEDGR